MAKSKSHEIGPLCSTTSRKISGLVFRQRKGKTIISRLPPGLGLVPKQLISSRELFKAIDKRWQEFDDWAKERWNVIGRRRHKLGYWVCMSYHLRLRRIPEFPSWTTDYPEDLDPKP